MPDNQLDISLFGKEYRVACTPEEREGLLEAVAYLDARLHELAARTGATGEKLAVMTALNITHEFVQHQRSGGFDMPDLRRRIGTINARLEALLLPQEKLF